MWRKCINLVEKTLLPSYFFIGIFAVLTAFLAFKVKVGLPPDEIYHIEIINHYVNNSLDPFIANQESSFISGDITRLGSYFYHYLLSLFIRMVGIFYDSVPIIFYRIPSVVLGVISLWTLVKVLQRIRLSKYIINLTIILVSQIPMFLLLSSAVNYDNLLILISTTVFLFTLKVRDEPKNIFNYLILVGLLSAGVIVKYAFLPVALVVFIYTLYLAHKNRRYIFSDLITGLKNKKIIYIAAIFFLLIFTALAIERYGYNIAKYQSIRPTCDLIHTKDQCMEYGIYARSQRLNSLATPDDRVNLFIYVANWLNLMTSRIYGVLAHHPFNNLTIVPMTVLLLVFYLFVMTIRKISKHDLEDHLPIFLVFFSLLVALFLANFRTYSNTNMIALAVQGRYVFPVLFPVIGIGLRYGFDWIESNNIRLAIFGILSLFSIVAGFPYLVFGFENWLV